MTSPFVLVGWLVGHCALAGAFCWNLPIFDLMYLSLLGFFHLKSPYYSYISDALCLLQ